MVIISFEIYYLASSSLLNSDLPLALAILIYYADSPRSDSNSVKLGEFWTQPKTNLNAKNATKTQSNLITSNRGDLPEAIRLNKVESG